ncbi:3-dehydroquinate synthase [Pseudobacter ginsenosidimutans]|uniref:3-dehydroquinate synthase n=1 Tax=Pseudobacter ginsenosidimutans TaxID=661488 RepID=A0A4Q7MFS0_9BACT|nr:3-dehydroquinate synthase [Pseudobacter ginsenosidimutans]QEC45492.1 3-dehydroquinate synthase [Pseudobacter ginsenosidimutans]RZS67026.1 3-dehydroquinate synthase [Pseudobacter ginsenosidimutans]
MQKKSCQFSSKKVDYYFDADFTMLEKLAGKEHTVIITDENIFQAQAKKFKGWNCIVLKPGEAFKVQATVDSVIEQLIESGADRKTTLVGVGGGVVTDITGYVAAIYMRGIRCGFVPSTILAMVDASIGGKNGVDVGIYKNLVGTIRQPDFLLYDYSLLKTLPDAEWINGFAEIIKHSCIRDLAMFKELESKKLNFYKKDKSALGKLILRNAMLKSKVVEKDEFEQGDRRLLNFGHTLGHAIENMYELSHGQAISIGMTAACHLSAALAGFKETERVVKVLSQYGLPTYAEYDHNAAFEVLKKDKKKERTSMNYVLLEKIGKGIVQQIPMNQLQTLIQELPA